VKLVHQIPGHQQDPQNVSPVHAEQPQLEMDANSVSMENSLSLEKHVNNVQKTQSLFQELVNVSHVVLERNLMQILMIVYLVSKELSHLTMDSVFLVLLVILLLVLELLDVILVHVEWELTLRLRLTVSNVVLDSSQLEEKHVNHVQEIVFPLMEPVDVLFVALELNQTLHKPNVNHVVQDFSHLMKGFANLAQ
jgi:hypothetical protein